MRKLIRIFTALVFMGLLLFHTLPAAGARLLPPRHPEESFLQWYQTHKNDQTASLTLTGDLFLTETAVLDGTGNVTIDCGSHCIVVAGSVALQNPNLTITGEGYVVVVVNASGTLTLAQGSITGKCAPVMEGAPSCALQNAGGTLRFPEGDHRFTIQMEGENVIGLSLYFETLVRNLDVAVTGSREATGIDQAFPGDLAVEGCTVQATGGDEAVGIRAESGVNVKSSGITAVSPGGRARSLISNRGRPVSADEASQLVPGLPDSLPDNGYAYRITGLPDFSWEISLPQNAVEAKLPKQAPICAYPTSPEQTGPVHCEIPVRWDRNALWELARTPGKKTLYGTLDTAAMEALGIAPASIQLPLSVTVTEGNGLPVSGITLLGGEPLSFLMTTPYPNGAVKIDYEYSPDGDEWIRFANTGETLDYPVGNKAALSGKFTLPGTKACYVRAVVTGGAYDGAGAAVLLGGEAERPPPVAADDSQGGDRGGQQTVPERKPESPSVQPAQDQSAPEAPAAPTEESTPAAAGNAELKPPSSQTESRPNGDQEEPPAESSSKTAVAAAEPNRPMADITPEQPEPTGKRLPGGAGTAAAIALALGLCAGGAWLAARRAVKK